MLASVSLTALSALVTMLLTGINHRRFILFAAAMRGGLVLALSAVLLPAFGAPGIGAALLATEGLTLALTFGWFVRRELAPSGGAIASALLLEQRVVGMRGGIPVGGNAETGIFRHPLLVGTRRSGGG